MSDKKPFNFEEWKKNKIRQGHWLSDEEYRASKKRRRDSDNTGEKGDTKKRKYSEESLKSHNILFEDFVKKHAPLHDIIEDLEDADSAINRKKIKTIINREIVLDTETTGLSNQDKIVEISLLELIDGIKTGRTLQYFFNPVIKISRRAQEIHRITNEKVANAPLFGDKAEEIIKFIGEGVIIAHNAKFDQRMLNNELKAAGWKPYPDKRFIDTLEIARFLYPKQKNDQDSLCQRFSIDNHNRITTGIHSAYEDTIQLYFIYTNLCELLKEEKLSPYDFKIKHTTKVD